VARPDPALLAAWDARLAKDGLASIDEDDGAGGIAVKGHRFDPDRVVEYQAAQAYYEEARQLASQVRDPDDRAIWTLHTEGQEVSDIAATLGIPRRLVKNVLTRLRRQMHHEEDRCRV
jgi:DNA-directed RNA polymerase specialized sigma24 family protein